MNAKIDGLVLSSTPGSSKISAKGRSHLDKLEAAETPTKFFCLPFMVGFETEANLKISQARGGKCHKGKVWREGTRGVRPGVHTHTQSKLITPSIPTLAKLLPL
jgi:hypothetical protein